MNGEESLELLERGKDAWNEWATQMLEERKALKDAGAWVAGWHEPYWTRETEEWHERAAADFSGLVLVNRDFCDFTFPGISRFDKAKLSGETRFERAQFKGKARFEQAQFMGETSFDSATFGDEVQFEAAEFKGPASFVGVVFGNKANFDHVEFWKTSKFKNAIFERYAGFESAEFRSNANFKKAGFKNQAGFIDTNFEFLEFNETTFKGFVTFELAEFQSNTYFKEVKFEDDVSFNHVKFLDSADFGKTIFWSAARFDSPTKFSAFVSFNEAIFEGDAVFNGAEFKGRAVFSDAAFRKKALFGGAEFEKGEAVQFDGTDFEGHVIFRRSKFGDVASFERAKFGNYTEFIGAKFENEVRFQSSTFRGDARFDSAEFHSYAGFDAIESKSIFSLAGVEFQVVPSFLQAHFAEAPRIIMTPNQVSQLSWSTLFKVETYKKGDQDLSARWRDLKRLAVQGHDHIRELEFFRNELKTRRWTSDKPWHLVFWISLFYDWTSDFGHSIVRPLVWWVLSALIFAVLYLGPHFDLMDPGKRPPSVLGWTATRVVLHPLGVTQAAALSCRTGRGDPWQAALGLSARKALLIFGLDASDKSKLHYACLYGVVTEPKVPPGKFLDVPGYVIFIGVTQHIFSAIMLFLVLLGIRNHFRIK